MLITTGPLKGEGKKVKAHDMKLYKMNSTLGNFCFQVVSSCILDTSLYVGHQAWGNMEYCSSLHPTFTATPSAAGPLSEPWPSSLLAWPVHYSTENGLSCTYLSHLIFLLYSSGLISFYLEVFVLSAIPHL